MVFCGLSFCVQLKKIKFHFRTESKGNASRFCIRNGFFQQASGITDKRAPIWMGNAAEHANNSAVFRSPGKYHQGIRFWMEQQIRFGFIAEACNGRTVNGNAIGKSPRQFIWHDGDIFLFAKNVAKRQTDEFDIFFLDIL